MRKLLLIISTVAALTMMISCAGSLSHSNAEDSVPRYELQTLELVDQQITLQFPAILRGNNDAEIYPKVSERITGIFFENGDLVKKGQKLFTLYDKNQQMEVVTKEAAVESAKASVNTAKLNLDSQKELFEKGIVSEYVYQTAQNSYSTALSQLAEARAQLTIAKSNLDDYTIVSPITGVVDGREFNIGSYVSPNMSQPLTKVTSQSLIIAQFSIAETQFHTIIEKHGLIATPNGYRSKDGDSLDSGEIFQLQLSNGMIYNHKGRFRSLTGTVNSETGAAICQVNFQNPEGILHSGNSATVLMPILKKGVFVVPQSACQKLQDKYLLYKVGADNKAQSVIVNATPTDDSKQYIISSPQLKAGDQILANGVSRVTEGTRLR